MYTSVSKPTTGSGSQLTFRVEEGCGLRLILRDLVSLEQAEADARDGCML